MLKIKKGDMVSVAAGRDKGKKGKVMRIFPEANRAIVEGINFVKKHKRRTQQEQQHTGIIQIETPIALSNLRVICSSCEAPARVGFSILEDGSKARTCKKCGETI